MRNYKQPKRKLLIDIRLTTGLNITVDQNKIKKNCKLLKIDMSHSLSKISKRDNTSILTVGFGNYNYIQYEVKYNFNINELNNISNDYIPNEIKPLILQAYELTQIQTLKDLID